MLPEHYTRPHVRDRIALIASSFERLLGRKLVEAGNDPVVALWNAGLAIVAHGTEPDPLFFFANRAALAAFETTVESFMGLPSRLSAEEPRRDERQALLEQVDRKGFIDDYSGIRISARGRRFLIANAIVWNLTDARGAVHGQAATFVASPAG